MKQTIIIVAAGFFLIIGVTSIASDQVCSTTVRIGKSIVKTNTQTNTCEKETHMIGRGIIPKMTL